MPISLPGAPFNADFKWGGLSLGGGGAKIERETEETREMSPVSFINWKLSLLLLPKSIDSLYINTEHPDQADSNATNWLTTLC